MSSGYILLIILSCALVTWLPRIIPFILTKRLAFPDWLIRFLSYLPVSILTALLLQSLLATQTNGFPTIKGIEALACIPTLLVAICTKNLMATVIVGIITVALLRFLIS